MTTTLTNAFGTRRLLRWLCIVVGTMVVGSLAGTNASQAHTQFVAVHKAVSSPDTPSTAHQQCPRTSLSHSGGTCASVTFVGLIQSGDAQIPPAQWRSRRLAFTADSALEKLHASRLERPPRF